MRNVLILLNYNDFETTNRFIKYHCKSNLIDKIIVVDNKSTDDSFIRLKNANYINCDIVSTDVNGGYASGNDYGAWYAIKKYNPDIITIANPDTVIEDDAFKQIFNVLETREDAAIVSCIMKSSAQFHTLSAWKLPTYFDCCIACLNGIKKIFKKHLEYENSYFDINSGVKKVDVIAGSFFCIKKDAFEIINGFDHNTFLYYEEAILAQRVKKKGLQNYITCDTVYLHEHAVSINKNIQSIGKRLDILQASRLYYCKEYLNIGKLREFILRFLFYIGKTYYLAFFYLKNHR